MIEDYAPYVFDLLFDIKTKEEALEKYEIMKTELASLRELLLQEGWIE